jgi:hypothetical protein
MGRPSQPETKVKVIKTSFTAEEHTDFLAACAQVGISHNDAIRSFAAAVVATAKARGRVSFPIRLVKSDT